MSLESDDYSHHREVNFHIKAEDEAKPENKASLKSGHSLRFQGLGFGSGRRLRPSLNLIIEVNEILVNKYLVVL
jgi:hypothetical protein